VILILRPLTTLVRSLVSAQALGPLANLIRWPAELYLS